MRSINKILFLLLLPVLVTAQFQHNQLDSMHRVLQHAANDTIRMDACLKLGAYYDDVNLDSSVYYSRKRNSHCKTTAIKFKRGGDVNQYELAVGENGKLSPIS